MAERNSAPPTLDTATSLPALNVMACNVRWAYAESLPCPSPQCRLQIHDMLHVHPLRPPCAEHQLITQPLASLLKAPHPVHSTPGVRIHFENWHMEGTQTLCILLPAA